MWHLVPRSWDTIWDTIDQSHDHKARAVSGPRKFESIGSA